MSSSEVRQRLDQALRQALRARDKVAVSALRTALAAIDNAGAVPAAPAPTASSGGSPHFAGATAGLGAAEAERRSLTDADLVRIVQAEIAERQAAAQQYDRTHPDQADRLRRETSVLQSVLGTAAG